MTFILFFTQDKIVLLRHYLPWFLSLLLVMFLFFMSKVAEVEILIQLMDIPLVPASGWQVGEWRGTGDPRTFLF